MQSHSGDACANGINSMPNNTQFVLYASMQALSQWYHWFDNNVNDKTLTILWSFKGSNSIWFHLYRVGCSSYTQMSSLCHGQLKFISFTQDKCMNRLQRTGLLNCVCWRRPTINSYRTFDEWNISASPSHLINNKFIISLVKIIMKSSSKSHLIYCAFVVRISIEWTIQHPLAHQEIA